MKNFVIGLALGMAGGIMLACCPCVQDFATDAKDFVKKDVVDPMKRCMARKKRKMERVINNVKDDIEEVIEGE